jgi:predicted transcriptional regulator
VKSDRLTESVRIRLTADEKAELERKAAKADRTASALGRRAIRHYLERELTDAS